MPIKIDRLARTPSSGREVMATPSAAFSPTARRPPSRSRHRANQQALTSLKFESDMSAMTNSSDPVILARHQGVAIITLNRPAARNAINRDLAQALVDALDLAQDAGCIIVTGTDPAFCSGLDLRDLGVTHLVDLPQCAAALRASRVPLIAAVNGPAVTGGFEVALSCDFIVASDRAMFADTHVRVGVFPGPVLVDLPRRIGMARAREMSLTGNFVNAATAERIGLANHVVSHAELMPFAMELAAAIAEGDREMVAAMREDWGRTDGLATPDAHVEHNRFRAALGHAGKRGSDIAERRAAVLKRSREQRGS